MLPHLWVFFIIIQFSSRTYAGSWWVDMVVLWRPAYFSNRFSGLGFVAFTELHTRITFTYRFIGHVGVLAFLRSQPSTHSGVSPDDLETQCNRGVPIAHFYIGITV